VALSFKAPPGAIVRLGREEREAVHRMAGELRELGHEVVERDPDYPPSLWPAAYVRVLRGIHEDVRDFMPRPERLEARTRQVAWLGGQIGPDLVRRAREAERAQAARIGELFADVDLLLTPGCNDGPYPAGVMGRRGVLGWLLTAGERIPHYAAFNVTGQPAINVPAGFDDDGLPMGVQLVGRHGADDLLLAVARSLEERHDWAAHRPPAG